MRPVSLVKLTHTPDVLRRESPDARLGFLQVSTQVLNGAFAPTITRDLAVDVFAYLPIKCDEFRVNRLVNLLLCGLNELKDF